MTDEHVAVRQPLTFSWSPSCCGEVVGGGDVAAVDDRVEAVAQQLGEQGDQRLELRVVLAAQLGGAGGKAVQAGALAAAAALLYDRDRLKILHTLLVGGVGT